MNQSVGAGRYRRRVRIGGGIAIVALIGLALAHGAGDIGLTQAARLGAAALGIIALAVVAGPLRNETEPAVRLAPRAAGHRAARWQRLLARPPELVQAWAGRRRARTRRPEDVPGEWAGMEQIVRFSETSAMDFHVRLRPRLEAVVSRRLETAGIDRRDSDRVREVLGPLGPYVADPTPRPPAERNAPGVPAVAVRDLLRRAEELS